MTSPFPFRPFATSVTLASSLVSYAAYARPEASAPRTVDIEAKGISTGVQITGPDSTLACRDAARDPLPGEGRILRIEGWSVAGGLAGNAREWAIALERKAGPECQDVADALLFASRITFGFANVVIDGVLRCVDDGEPASPLNVTWREEHACLLVSGKARIETREDPTDWGVFDARVEIAE